MKDEKTKYFIKLVWCENGEEYEDELVERKTYADKDAAFLDAVKMAEEELDCLERENPSLSYEIPENTLYTTGKGIAIVEKMTHRKITKTRNVISFLITPEALK